MSATDLDQVYPYVGSGDITLSGTTTTPYDEAYLPVIKNAFRVKGGDNRLFDVEKVIYNYARSVSDVFEKEDNGTITVREGASFDNLNVTFDEVITDPLAKERSFSDEDQVEFESYGSILSTPTSAEDYGVIPQKLQGGIFLDEYQATFVKGNDAIVRGYEGLGTFKKEGVADTDRFFAYSGSGTATFSGENFFSQAPQSTIFGVGDKITASGSADEAFVPATVDNTVLFGISGDGAECRNILPTTRKALLRPSGSVSGIAIVTGSGDKSNTVLFNTSGAATDVVLVKDYENTNLFDISGGMQQGVPVYTPSWFSATGESATEEYDWGLITATPTQLSEDWGINQYKRRDNTQGCRELGIPSRRVQLRSSWRSTLSKQRYILCWRIQSCCSDFWNNRCCNVPTFRRSRYRSLRFNTNLLVLLVLLPTARHQHLRCKLVQSVVSSTHSLR